MATLTEERLLTLLGPYLEGPWGEVRLPAGAVGQLSAYLDLLMRWNARTNLTAVRSPEEMVRRHFGESLFAGWCLAGYLAGGDGAGSTVLDVGSGAGLPGLPIQLLLPAAQVTLAESQGKKVAFLREAVRTLQLATEVWAGRAEELPDERRFGAVTLRAVDRMAAAEAVARTRVEPGGVMLIMTTEPGDGGECMPVPERDGSFVWIRRIGE